MGLIRNIVSFWQLYSATDINHAHTEPDHPPGYRPPGRRAVAPAAVHDEEPAEIKARIAALRGVSHLAVAVDRGDCVVCGICAGSCPNGAISIGDSVMVEHEQCAACGACIATCPTDALTMVEE